MPANASVLKNWVAIMDMTRRSFLATTAATLASATTLTELGATAKAPLKNRWSDNFIWGVATAGHQIDGNNFSSDYWVLEHLAGTNSKEPSGDACDSWNRWREDLALVKSLGLSAYRFSIEWSRIEPEEGFFSNAALAHYKTMCRALRDADIMPIVTFHHFVSPRWVATAGGWESPQIVDRFVRYCERAAKTLGPLMGAAITMNEPNAQVTSYIMRGAKPFPGEADIVKAASAAVGSTRFGAYFMGDSFKVRDNCIAAHAKAVAAIGGVVPNLRTGLALALQDIRSDKSDGGEALYRRIFTEARLPFYEAASGDSLIGVQPYMRLQLGANGYLPASKNVLLNQDGQDASPNVIADVVREVHRYCRAPILVSENGIDTTDDTLRCQHLPAAVEALGQCVDEGINMLGYIHWSLLDNFEWRAGYKPRFGLVSVDRTTFARTPKPSAEVYRQLIEKARANRAAPARL